jgi:hypothetical protein
MSSLQSMPVGSDNVTRHNAPEEDRITATDWADIESVLTPTQGYATCCIYMRDMA